MSVKTHVSRYKKTKNKLNKKDYLKLKTIKKDKNKLPEIVTEVLDYNFLLRF